MSVSQVSECLSVRGEAGLGVLLPHLAPVVVEKTEVGAGLVRAWVRSRAEGAACPRCGRWCTKVHDSYTRTLADAGIGGRRVLIRLVVRLLRCGSAGCKATFAEQPPGLASPYARKTPLLGRQLAAVAEALAGRAGSRLAARVLAVEVSRHTLIRVLRALPEPAAGAVRVLGVDDFSLRKGHAYATLLVDMETGRPVDVLPDREAATFAAWLTEHPGVEVICRDRAGGYAQGAADGAPGAVQVADRWHLWHNLCEHVRDAAARHRACLAGPARGCLLREQDQEQAAGQEQQQRRQAVPADLEAVIRERHAAVHQLRAAGQTLAQAAAALGLGEQVTSRYWRAGTAADLLAVRGKTALDPYKPYLRRQWDEGSTKIAALHRDITAQGFRGSYGMTYAWLAQLKLAAPPKPPAPPTPAQVTALITGNPAALDETGHAQLTAIRARCPEIGALAGHVAGFAQILTGRHGGQLDDWLAAAGPGQPELRSFANGIRRDYQAVSNALTLPWSSGLVEGLNTRTKLLKRQMYGRAAFSLLRKRILLTS